MNIFIIGSGNIAFHMAKAFIRNNITISGLYARNKIEGRLISKMAKTQFYDKLKEIPKTADVYILCVSDDSIKIVAESLPESIKKSKIIAHTSGSKSIADTLFNCKNGGIFYPLQTFTKGKRMSYHKIPFCINGTNNKTIKLLTNLAHQISTSVQTIDDLQRREIHLSAVMISNFVNHIIYSAQDLLEQKNIDASILQPLLEETIRSQKKLGAFAAQTGPARRMDHKTMEVHLDMLKSEKLYKEIYKNISKSIQTTYNKKK